MGRGQRYGAGFELVSANDRVIQNVKGEKEA